MNNSPQPKPPLLSARDLYVMPCAAEAFVGMVVGHGRLPIRLHFTLADGRDFHLPISDIALRQLATALAALRQNGYFSARHTHLPRICSLKRTSCRQRA